MDYFSIIKKAFKVSLKNRFLWIFGILAGGTAGVSSFNFNMPSSGSSDSLDKVFGKDLSNIDWATFWTNYGFIILVIIGILAVLSIIFFILSLISQGALVGAAEKIEKDQQTEFGASFMVGWHNFWRIWGLNITLLLIILIGLSLLIIPVCILVIIDAYASAWVIGILFFIVNVLLWIVVGFISPYALRVVVLKKHSVFESIRGALHFVRDNLLEVLVMYLLLMVVGFAVGIAAVLVGLILMAILFVIGLGLYYISMVALVIYTIIAVLALFILCLAFSGAYATFTSTVLTFTYLKLTNKD